MNRPVLAVAVLIFNGILLLNSADAQSSLPTADASAAVTSEQWLQRVPPVYPPPARNAGIEGDVVLDVVIGADGTVDSAIAVRGDPFLTQSAVDAVKQWKTKPSGVEVRTQVTIKFSLKGPGAPDATNVVVAGNGAETSTASTASLKALPASQTAAQNTSQQPAGNTAEFIRKAESGDAQAQFELGRMYDNGQGVTKDEAEAVRWYRKAAEQGHEWAQYDLGVAYDNGEGVAKDATEALRWYRKAAEQGDSDAQYSLGVAYHEAQGVTKDDAEAVRWFRKAAERGSAEAQLTLGQMYDSGQGIRKNKAEAALWYRKAAEQGNVSAQANLGLMYSNGQGVSLNRREADHWYQKAAEGREAIRQTEEGASQSWTDPATGLMWTRQSKGNVNWKQAQEYCSTLNLAGHSDWRLATGYPLSGDELYSIYDRSQEGESGCHVRGGIRFQNDCTSWTLDGGVKAFYSGMTTGAGPDDKLEALCVRGFATVTLRRLSSMADQGDAQAQYSIGMAYLNGKGVPKSDAEAVSYFRKAAEQGNADAQVALNRLQAIAQCKGNAVCIANTEILNLAEHGDANAQLKLAYAYASASHRQRDWSDHPLDDSNSAEAIAKDRIAAARWFLKAAEQGNVEAQYNLGLLYGQNDGSVEILVDEAEAVRWYRKAAEQGLAAAQYKLGFAYHYGKGVLNNEAEATRWFRKAAEQGDEDAQQALATALADAGAIGYSMEHGPDGGPGVELVGTVISTSQANVLDQVGNKLTRPMVTFRLDFPDHKEWYEAICLHKEVDGGSGTPGETATMTLECQSFIPGKRYRFVASRTASLIEFHPVAGDYPMYLYQGWKRCMDSSTHCYRLADHPIHMIRRAGGEVEQ